jgi:hypothetical protein
MKPGMPDFSQIVFKILMQRTPSQAGMHLAGQNANLKQPLERFSADLAISMRNIEFEMTPDGVHHGNLEVGLVAYDLNGHAVNWSAQEVDLNLTREQFLDFRRNGLQMRQEIDVPSDQTFLRCGIYDLRSKRAGTLQIPLQVVEASAPK